MLTRHQTAHGARWAYAGRFLTSATTLEALLEVSADGLANAIAALHTEEEADGMLLPPIEHHQEIWASGVTYLRSRVAREEESESSADVYSKVYDADRPELFFKCNGWRAAGDGMPIRVRVDSSWDVPEPEVTLVINRHGEIVGYTVGNDVSSRSIEGENPLYLPQAKLYNGCSAIGPGILLADPTSLRELQISLEITRQGTTVFTERTSTNQMKRQFEELVDYLFRELDFPHGALLMTGTGIVPEDGFTLQPGDVVTISVGDLMLSNPVGE